MILGKMHFSVEISDFSVRLVLLENLRPGIERR